MKKIQNLKNNNLITKTNNKLKNQLKKKPKLKTKLKTKSKSKNQESSHLIQRNISEEVLVTWKPSREDSSLKNLKRKNSKLTPSETHSILVKKIANNKSNQNQLKKLNLKQPNQLPNNNQNKKSKKIKRKTIWLNLKKPWKNSVLKVLKVKRRKRKLKRLKKQLNKLQLLKQHQSHPNRFNNHQLKTLLLISTFLLKLR